MSTILSLTEAPKRKRVVRRRRRQSRGALARARRATVTSLVAGGIVGGFVPAAVYVVSHLEVAARPELWVLVAGGSLFSASTVWGFIVRALGSRVKAAGFVALVEGVLVFSGVQSLGLAALALLIGINAIETGNQIAK